MNEAWMVRVYGEAGAESGYGIEPQLLMENLTKATAKAIARFKNRKAPGSIWYSAEPEPERWV